MNIRSILGSFASLRTMAIAVCVLTNVYFLSIFWYPLDWPTANSLLGWQMNISLLMVALFFLLRYAMATLTAARAEDLDELQLKMRDDAYRLGYLVVRRVGLGVFAATFILVPLAKNFVYGGHDSNSREFYFQGAPVREYLQSWLQGQHLIEFAAQLFFVLAFTAYCFPIVVLAWRNASFQAALTAEERVALVATPQLAPLDELNVRALASSIQIHVARFRNQLTVVAVAWPTIIAFGLSAPLLFSGISNGLLSTLIGVAGPLMLFTLWTLFAGMFKQQVLIKVTRNLSQSAETATSTYQWVLWLSVATGVFSFVLPTLFFGASVINSLGLANIGWQIGFSSGFATLICQTASFIVAGRAAKRIVTNELANLANTPAELPTN